MSSGSSYQAPCAKIEVMDVQIQGKNIHYEALGKGRPLLLVHGWGGSAQSLEKLATILSADFQTIVVDLPGFGTSDNPDPTWGVEEYANLLAKLIENLKLKNVIYFGHSFGGSLGVQLAVTKPKLIDTLILCAASYHRTGHSSSAARKLKRILPIPAPLKRLAYRIFFPKSELYKLPALESNFRRIVTTDLTQELSQIAQNTLILWGARDTYTPVENARAAKELIKNSTLKVFDDLGHGLPLYQPELVAAEIENFVNKKI